MCARAVYWQNPSMSRFGDLTIEDCRRKCTDVRSSTACLYDARKRVCTTGWDAQQCNPQPPTSEEDYRYYAGFCREECSPASNPSRSPFPPTTRSSMHEDLIYCYGSNTGCLYMSAHASTCTRIQIHTQVGSPRLRDRRRL